MADSEVRSFGAWVLILADALLMLGLIVIYGGIRFRLKEWPDVVATAVVNELLPLLAVGGIAVGAFLHHKRRGLVLVFVSVAVAVVALILTWIQAQNIGLTARSGRYAMIVYLVLFALIAHAVGAVVVVGRAAATGKGTEDTPNLRRYLDFLAVMFAVVVVAVFVW